MSSFASSPPVQIGAQELAFTNEQPYNSSSDPLFVPDDMSTDIFQASSIPSEEVRYLRDTNSKQHERLAEIVKSKLLSLCQSDFEEEAHRQHAAKPAIKLSAEQQQVHEMIVHQKRSLFFTGAAGTGKSILLRRIIEDLRKAHGHHSVAVTAPTGIAAVAIGGRTVHAWSGIGLGNGDAKALLKAVKRQRPKVENWKACKTLVIDEISMLSPDLLDKLNFIAQKIKNNERPFGGIQLVCTGDFFQLPPVEKDKAVGDKRNFAFDAACWKECISATILLTQVFRQKDHHFQDMLNELRHGQLSPDTIATFKKLSRAPKLPDDVVPTKLFSLRREVDTANSAALQKLAGEPRVYDAVDLAHEHLVNGKPHKVDITKLQWMAPDKVRLKEGAQVMMIKNIDSMLVNGSIGRVIKFIPKPAMTGRDDRAVIPLSDMIHSVQSYTSQELLKMDRNLDKPVSADTEIVPLVRFYNRDGTVREMVVSPERWVQENEHGEVIASREQIPLILAYALSIHKSQGQTLDYVSVSMNKVFEAGQAYVALSRATTLDGLQVTGFHPGKVMTDDRVTKFYKGLSQITRSYQPSVADMFKRNEPVEDPLPDLFGDYAYKKPKGEEPDDLFVKSEQPTESVCFGAEDNDDLVGVKHEPLYPRFHSDMSMPFMAAAAAPPALTDSSDIELPPPPPPQEPDYDSDFDSSTVNYTYRSRQSYSNIY